MEKATMTYLIKRSVKKALKQYKSNVYPSYVLLPDEEANEKTALQIEKEYNELAIFVRNIREMRDELQNAEYILEYTTYLKVFPDSPLFQMTENINLETTVKQVKELLKSAESRLSELFYIATEDFADYNILLKFRS